jgi:hypothetical protein
MPNQFPELSSFTTKSYVEHYDRNTLDANLRRIDAGWLAGSEKGFLA